MTLLRKSLTYGLFPLTFTASLCTAAWAHAAGYDEGLILAMVTLAVVLIVAIGERLSPAHDMWNRSQGDVGTDMLHASVSMVLLPPLLEMGIRAGLLAVVVAVGGAEGGGIWPTAWPLAAQVVLAMVVSQFGEYWVHRAGHQIPFLWRFHSVHHSVGRLYWLNAGRFHPVDTAALFIVGLGLLMVLGAGPEVLLLVSVWISVHGLFQHCNIHLRLGPLNAIFSMAELHRWHHSLRLEEANANYGNNILLWDWVFGTVYWPRDREASETVGLDGMPHYPTRWWAQVMAPFRWSRVRRGGPQG